MTEEEIKEIIQNYRIKRTTYNNECNHITKEWQEGRMYSFNLDAQMKELHYDFKNSIEKKNHDKLKEYCKNDLKNEQIYERLHREIW